MRRSHWISLLVIVGVAVVALGFTVGTNKTPKLGLDLQGGASVVLQPKHKVPSGVLDQSIEIIRSRVDNLGVAEPDISRQGNAIIVQLPGVKNKERALQVVGQTAQLFVRPVIREVKENEATVPTTPPEQDDPKSTVVLPVVDRGKHVITRYELQPAEFDGRVMSGARATIDPNTGVWQVDFTLTGKGSKLWDEMAGKYYQKQVAIELDGVVKSAPTIQAQQFNGRGQITGNFTQREAKDLALVIRYGALPVQLEPQTVQTVSATLGRDALSAGLIAGAVGLGLVALYMVLYYRALGFVVWLGLLVSGALMYSIVALLGDTSGLALSLAGATGIIVSVGVTVDSYVVYFERLKDEIRAGKTVRSSVDRGFARAYRTILAADLVSLIGAALLYLLSVGSVRGFAFFLGLSTILDLVIAYMFTRPMVVLLGRNRLFTEARWLGVARGLAASPSPGA
jgi:preprotein translocase subunit SecD